MPRPILHAAWLLLLSQPIASAAVLAGVTLPASVTVEGRTLTLNGTGLRTRMMFKVYVAGLYLEAPTTDPAALLQSDGARRIQLSMLRDMGAAKVTEAITAGFERNSADHMAGLKKRLDELNAMIPDVATGDTIVLTYVPGKGTVVEAKGDAKGVLPGKDFADALFAVWLGASPVQADLKAALLAGTP
jgi:hypothetical protein